MSAPSPSVEQIKASAGSGKTYALTQRFLELLARAGTRGATACGRAEPDGAFAWTDILAATFTNKAAEEMRQRVVGRLKRYALKLESPPPKTDVNGTPAPLEWTPAKAAFWVDMLLRRYGSLNIRTIDSLLISLVRLCALELGLPPDFEPAFDWSQYADPLYEEALDPSRPDAEEIQNLLRAAFADLVRHADMKGFSPGKGLRRDLALLLDRVITEGPLPVHAPGELAARRAHLAAQTAEAATALHYLLKQEGLNANAIFLKHLLECEALDGSAPFPERAWPYKEDLDDCLNKTSKGRASAAAHGAFAAYRTVWAKAEGGVHLYTQAMRLAPLAALANLLGEMLPAFQHREGLVPHALTPVLAGRILERGAATDAFCRLGTRIAHILVDEFQDTSRAQWAALEPLAIECLSTGGSLTVVGDVKQAIYRWRGGDAALFDEVPERDCLTAMLEGGPALTRLELNRRSCPAIVEHNNRVFESLADLDVALDVVLAMLPARRPPYVPEDAPMRAAGRVAAAIRRAFDGARQGLPEQTATPAPGYVRLEPLHGARSAELHEMLHDRLFALFTEDLGPRRAWRDIAVLVHKNSEAALIAGWLMDWDIPVITDQSLTLAGHPLIRQTVAFLAFMDNPADDIAFWALAGAHTNGRPSLLGESLAALGLGGPTLTDWLMEYGASRYSGGLGALFREHFPHAWERLFAPFHNQAGLIGPYDAVAELFDRFGVFQRFPEEDAHARRFLEVVHQAESRGLLSLSAFLEHWAEHGGDERVPLPESLDAVRIMTMHKAKGLQFPVVVIPFHHQWSGELPPALCEVDGLQLLARPHPAQGESYYLAHAETAVEKIHVLYVAWTRAVEELHGFLTTTDKARHTPLARGLDALLRAAGIDPERPYETGCRPSGRASFPLPPPETPETAPHSLPEDENWRPMQWLPRLKIYRSPLEQLRREADATGGLSEAQRGLFVHSCLEQLTALAPGANSPEALEVLIDDATRAAVAAFPLHVPAFLPEEAARLLRWLLRQPEAARWLTRGIPEQSILDEGGTLHRTDLLVPEDGGFTVVEYKTGGRSPAHTEQLGRYLTLLRRRDEKAALSGRLVYLDLCIIENVEEAVKA